jgi:Na+-driven multidrug efflux pump
MLGTTYHAACFTGINRGAGDGKFVVKVDMICGWLVVLPLMFLAAFVFCWPLPIVFLCSRIDQCFKWIIAFFRLRGNKWIRNVTR